jgi:anti-sigma factor RsiW
MDNLELQQLKDLLARRGLTPEERARLSDFLARQPDRRTDWQTDEALTRLLTRLPDLPVSSNFAAQVLQAVDPPPRHSSRWRWLWLGFRRPAVQFAGVALCVGVTFSGLALRQSVGRARMATSVASVVRSVEAASSLAQLPPVEILQDFEAIHRFSPPPAGADLELLEALAVN